MIAGISRAKFYRLNSEGILTRVGRKVLASDVLRIYRQGEASRPRLHLLPAIPGAVLQPAGVPPDILYSLMDVFRGLDQRRIPGAAAVAEAIGMLDLIGSVSDKAVRTRMLEEFGRAVAGGLDKMLRSREVL